MMRRKNLYTVFSRCIAVAAGFNMVIVGSNAAILNTAVPAEEKTTTVNLPNIQSDLEFETSELLLSDVISNKASYSDNTSLLYDKFSTREAIQEPIAEKIATDWEPPTSFKAKEFTYQIRTYSAEEIANNALTPYKIPSDTATMFYYYDNMEEAVATPYCPEYANDEDLYLTAKIIHAEICTLGDEARRCVGTAIINRAWNSDHPNTIYDVIHEKGQFSTQWTTKEPCSECLSAAYDVLYNGYRSFPHYVDSFQSIRDNYFSGHKTYIAFNDGTYKTYFSYNTKKTRYTEYPEE